MGEAILFGLVARSEAIINVDEDILLSDLTNKYLSIRSGIYLGMGWIIWYHSTEIEGFKDPHKDITIVCICWLHNPFAYVHLITDEYISVTPFDLCI